MGKRRRKEEARRRSSSNLTFLTYFASDSLNPLYATGEAPHARLAYTAMIYT
jgi:hypothetical protein